jgi:hypothetical protein
MVVVLEVVVDYRVVDMVCPDEMFEGPGTFLGRCLDIMNVDRGDVNVLGRIGAGREIPVKAADQRHPGDHWSRHAGRLGELRVANISRLTPLLTSRRESRALGC